MTEELSETIINQYMTEELPETIMNHILQEFLKKKFKLYQLK